MTDDGGPAFPANSTDERRGMSLRDWFAGQAMMVVADDAKQRGVKIDPDVFAERAYQLADAMLEARKK